jgi:hypothetical protein
MRKSTMIQAVVTITISIVLSVVLTGYLTKILVAEHADIRREFKVIDINALTLRLMENLEAQVKESDTHMTPEMIEFIAKQEARKMYSQIALHENGNNIILPKKAVLFVPQAYDVTQDIADRMNLGHIGKTGLNKLVDNDKDEKDADN